jgi:hypothetical protein
MAWEVGGHDAHRADVLSNVPVIWLAESARYGFLIVDHRFATASLSCAH